jgi:hypothetical protein
VLDNFNGGAGFGPNWSVASVFSRSSNNVRVTGTGTMRWTGSTGGGPVYAADQEAYLTFVKVSPTATEQGLFLKITGNGNNPNPTDASAAYIEVSYKATSPTSVQVRTKANGTNTVVLQGTQAATFAATDQLGARALADGRVIVYKNGAAIGTVNVSTTANPWPAANVAGGGRLGVRFVGAQNNTTNDARFDDFGGGSVTVNGYTPNVYEVGPGNPFATIQAAVGAAATSIGNDLVVVYPGEAPTANPRLNPRGAYYENLILTTPVKLQGVGPGGVRGTETVRGSIIDGGSFGGDGATAAAWYGLIDGLTWDGNQTIFDGAVVSIYTHDGDFTAAFKGAIDGFDIRGGDQQGFPGNINEIGGGNTGLPPGLITQGGAVFANAYARHLQITNNVVQNNGGAYGTIRIGTPDVAPSANHNENVRIANNRVIANGGTNLAGGIGLFAGSDAYTVTGNDICGNFSAEYGGGVSAYGFSPGGSIDHNRIWFNQSYDEGGGVMIAGALPSNPATLSAGSGAVTIHDNVIQSNLANDDGGGVRFLQAGNFPIDVYNNMIVNNVSTHEGGGVGLNDAPDVRFYNNTVMKNITTATALTSNGFPAPAGLSTSQNSAPLQATLPGAAPVFSDPLLFNNIFWDNRAGARGLNGVLGIGASGDPTPINFWDMGVADGTGLLSPTNSVLQTAIGTVTSATNSSADPLAISPYDTQVAFNAWRTNPNFFGAFLISLDLPPGLLGDYHIPATSSAFELGAASKGAVAAAATDIDGTIRPQGAGFDAGADEVVVAPVAPFPNTAVLDNFNRANAGNLGPNWSTPSTGFRVNTNTLEIRGNAAGAELWTASFGANQEAYFTFADVSGLATEQGLVLKAATGSMIRVVYRRSTSTVTIQTLDPSNGLVTQGTPITGVTFVNGDTFGARTLQDGAVRVYRNGTLIGAADVSSGATPWPTALAQSGGQVGAWFVGTTNTQAGNARIDNFGGGNLP